MSGSGRGFHEDQGRRIRTEGGRRWHEYAVRFFFGGLITAATGLIARNFRAVIGGLFLAFPAIPPASATLLEKHEREKKDHLGLHGSVRKKGDRCGRRRSRTRKSWTARFCRTGLVADIPRKTVVRPTERNLCMGMRFCFGVADSEAGLITSLEGGRRNYATARDISTVGRGHW
jgi:hypothetical protein